MSRVVPATRPRTRQLTLPGIRSAFPSSSVSPATASQAVAQSGDRPGPCQSALSGHLGHESTSRTGPVLNAHSVRGLPGRAQPTARGVRSFESSDLRSRSAGISGNSHGSAGRTRGKDQPCRRLQLPEYPSSAAAIRHPSRSRSTPPLRLPLGLGHEGPVLLRSGHPTRRRPQDRDAGNARTHFSRSHGTHEETVECRPRSGPDHSGDRRVPGPLGVSRAPWGALDLCCPGRSRGIVARGHRNDRDRTALLRRGGPRQLSRQRNDQES